MGCGCTCMWDPHIVKLHFTFSLPFTYEWHLTWTIHNEVGVGFSKMIFGAILAKVFVLVNMTPSLRTLSWYILGYMHLPKFRPSTTYGWDVIALLCIIHFFTLDKIMLVTLIILTFNINLKALTNTITNHKQHLTKI